MESDQNKDAGPSTGAETPVFPHCQLCGNMAAWPVGVRLFPQPGGGYLCLDCGGGAQGSGMGRGDTVLKYHLSECGSYTNPEEQIEQALCTAGPSTDAETRQHPYMAGGFTGCVYCGASHLENVCPKRQPKQEPEEE